MADLLKHATEGGSWYSSVSLATTGRWFGGLGRVEGGLACPYPTQEDVAGSLEDSDSGFGRLTTVRDAAGTSVTPPR